MNAGYVLAWLADAYTDIMPHAYRVTYNATRVGDQLLASTESTRFCGHEQIKLLSSAHVHSTHEASADKNIFQYQRLWKRHVLNSLT